ncbi:pfkB family carbohydrate kinase [Phytophthora infestans]|uniref:PfkB family carbohydrate kinase n=1 Tax=Phytophthora infestans TaxID=4787 RepID=A0A833T4H6_PHYIN|nr:pfkB family carbohydrate kinase [Phytophthora infestans]
MDVIGVGIAIIDVIHEVAAYPEEDLKIRSLESRKCRGGNVANALVVCSQLGSRCRWLGVSTDPEKDSDAAFVYNDLAAYGVDCSLVSIETQGNMPISLIFSSRATGSRIIIHSRNLVELSYEAFVKQLTLYRGKLQDDENHATWFHFEGRNLGATEKMMLHVRKEMPTAKISVEIEAIRNDWVSAMKLISLADYTFISKDYIREKLAVQSAEQLFDAVVAKQWGSKLALQAKAFICPWGAEGVYFLNVPRSVTHHLPASHLHRVIETIGAGDSFIGAALAGFSSGKLPLEDVLKTACEVASAKCLKQGFAMSLEEQTKWQKKIHSEIGNVGANAA